MSRARFDNQGRREAGFSLIELMIAMVLALLVSAGIISVFQSTSGSNRVQRQMAVLQEEGRYAVTRIRQDLLAANSQYCSNSGGNADQTSGGVALDSLRSPTVYANNGTNVLNSLPDLTNALPNATTPFSVPSSIFMRGYDCSKTACLPTDPTTWVKGFPAQGKTANKRVVGSSVLTVRYLDPAEGWSIVPPGVDGTQVEPGTGGGTLTKIDINPLAYLNEPDASHFQAGDLALLSDCSNGQIFTVSGQGTPALVPTSDNFAQPQAFQYAAAPKLFDFNQDFITVTYYLKVVDNGNGGTTGVLMRRVNGKEDGSNGSGEIARGVERLNFLYGVINADGETQFLSANQVDTATDANGNAIPCPPDVSLPGGMPSTGCLWRAVKTIEVDLLMDGQTPLYTLGPGEMAYTYTQDGVDFPAPPTSGAFKVLPSDQGFPNQLIRREFTTLVSLRNFNP